METTSLSLDLKDSQKTMKKNHSKEDNESLAQEVNNGSGERVIGSPNKSSESFCDEARDGPPQEPKETEFPMGCRCRTRKLSRHEKIELGRKLQDALSFHDWDLAESLITGTDVHTLNDALCMSLDSIWFLSTFQELNGLTALIKKIVFNGASDFTRAALRTSFLASCVSACQSGSMSLAETVNFVAQR